MSLSRFEAFTDAVFAIAITLLIIEVKAPDLSRATPGEAVAHLVHLWPHLLSYVTSFFVIGVVWLNHHAMFHFVRRVDRQTLTLNLFLLLCVAFVPFPTALLGSYGHLRPVVMFYGLSLALLGVAWNVLWFDLVRRAIAPDGLMSHAALRKANLWSLSWPLAYALATLLALANTRLAVALYALIPLFYLFPGVFDRQLRRETRAENLKPQQK